jgi:ribosomal protein S18 acetylase RimI-like enzyme
MRSHTEPGERSSGESPNSNRRTTPTSEASLVRVATERDRTGLRALLAAAAGEVGDRRGATLRLASLPSGPDRLLSHLLSATDSSVLVAEGVGGLLGFALLSLDPPRLLAIYVAIDERRKGIGRALVTEAADVASQRGSGAFAAVAAAGDRAEKSLYEALGYRAELLVMAPRTRRAVVDQDHE